MPDIQVPKSCLPHVKHGKMSAGLGLSSEHLDGSNFCQQVSCTSTRNLNLGFYLLFLLGFHHISSYFMHYTINHLGSPGNPPRLAAWPALHPP